MKSLLFNPYYVSSAALVDSDRDIIMQADRSPLQGTEDTFADPALPNGTRTPFPSVFAPAEVDISVVVPAFNEEARLPQMIDEALRYLSERANANPTFAYELIVVNDGSTDSTESIAFNYVKKLGTDKVRVLTMEKNTGKGGAVRKGMLSTRGHRLLMADADGATKFSDVELLEKAMLDLGVDVAIGSRVHLRGKGSVKGRGLFRSFLSLVFNLVVIYVGGVRGLGDTQCGFKLYSRNAAKIAFGGQRLRRWAFDVENLYRVQHVGLQIAAVPVHWKEVPGSKLNVVKATLSMIYDMLRMRFKYLKGDWVVPSTPLRSQT